MPPAEYHLTVEPRGTYLHVRVTGPNTPETVAGYVGEAIEACHAHGVHRLLVEEALTGPSLSPVQMFDIIDGASRKGPPALTIAYVDVNPEHDTGRLQLAETVARNRGFLFSLFASVREAEEWLASS